MRRGAFLFVMLIVGFSGIMANTSRDIEPGPDYNRFTIRKLVILYINIERVNAGNPAFVISKKLNMAAQWHSDYMAETEKVAHMADKKGMRDVEQRVTSFGEKIDRYAEILSFSLSLNAEDLKYEKRKDPGGEYIDFGKTNVRWYNETEIAMIMIRGILSDPVYKSYIANSALNSIGGGIASGRSRDIASWYGSFAVVQKKDVIKQKLKVDSKRDIITKKVNNKDVEETIITYEIEGLSAGRVCLLAMSSSGAYRTFLSSKTDGRYKFVIDDEFRSRLAEDEKLYVAAFDDENDTFIPVTRIDVLK